MMDEAFMPFREIVERMLAFPAVIYDEKAGVRSYIYECEIDAPVELDIAVDSDGTVRIGSTPPLYYVDTSFRPSFHRVLFTARMTGDIDGQ